MLKAEGVKRSRNRYYLLNVNQTLKTNLANKTIVEYPLVYISYEELPEGFDIIGSGRVENFNVHLFYFSKNFVFFLFADEDIEEETKQHRLNLQKMWKSSLSEEQGTNMEDSNPADEIVSEKEKKRKRKKERFRKLEIYEKTSNNYLFSDEKLMEALSSSTDSEED